MKDKKGGMVEEEWMEGKMEMEEGREDEREERIDKKVSKKGDRIEGNWKGIVFMEAVAATFLPSWAGLIYIYTQYNVTDG